VSILLEALRKSEKNQNPPEAPDIHSDDESARTAESIQTGPLAILLVLALFASGWFVWNQYQAPEGVYQPPVTLADNKPAGSDTQATEIVTAAVENEQSSSSTTEVAGKPLERATTPVESYQQTVKNISKAKPVDKRPAAAVKAQAVAKSVPEVKRSRPAAEKSSTKPRPMEPAPITYWELPDPIRADVAEIKFSVLVYAKQPQDRFVLINGQRFTEGDSVQPGLVIEEIQRDGVTFSYRLYRFLVER
jgi:general secretion pathway protein B